MPPRAPTDRISVKPNRTSTLRSKNSPVTQEDFDVVLSALLKGKSPPGIATLKDVEVVASVDTKKSITLIIRKRTADITVCVYPHYKPVLYPLQTNYFPLISSVKHLPVNISDVPCQ